MIGIFIYLAGCIVAMIILAIFCVRNNADLAEEAYTEFPSVCLIYTLCSIMSWLFVVMFIYNKLTDNED